MTISRSIYRSVPICWLARQRVRSPSFYKRLTINFTVVHSRWSDWYSERHNCTNDNEKTNDPLLGLVLKRDVSTLTVACSFFSKMTRDESLWKFSSTTSRNSYDFVSSFHWTWNIRVEYVGIRSSSFNSNIQRSRKNRMINFKGSL